MAAGDATVVGRFQGVRQGWLIFLALLGLSALRNWLRSRAVERFPSRHSQGGRRPEGRRTHSRPEADRASGGDRRGGGGFVGFAGREAAFAGRASEEELGEAWHCEGHRRWAWLHDGSESNGWIEFGAAGTLRTSFGGGGKGGWERSPGPSEEVVVTFGKCHHVLEIIPETKPAMFFMKERRMRDGSAVRSNGPPRTKGRAESNDYEAPVSQRPRKGKGKGGKGKG